MEIEYHQWGHSILKEDITSTALKGLLTAVEKNPFATLVDVQRLGSEEAAVLDIEVELPQKPPIAIRHIERVCVVFSVDPAVKPIVLCLRKDFPITLHQNMVIMGSPKSLCLFEESYAEVISRITPQMMLQRITDWFARAALDELHLDSQVIEPLLLTQNRIIFDPSIFTLSNDSLQNLVIVRYSENPLLLRAFAVNALPRDDKVFFLIAISATPHHSRRIEDNPSNLEQLVDLLRGLQVDPEQIMRTYIKDILDRPNHEQDLKRHVIILISLPRLRKDDGPVEGEEYWAFLLVSPVEDLAARLGIADKANGRMGRLLGPPISKGLDSIGVLPLKPTIALNNTFAQVVSGISLPEQRIVAIGAGALGSQVILNLARQGFGKWHIVDPDFVLPHNLARHALFSGHLGLNKAAALSAEINGILNSGEISVPYPIDFLQDAHDGLTPLVKEAMSKSDLIIDFSTSRAVTRFLSVSEDKGRKVCVFISASGRHLVILVEGDDKSINLEDLNYQLAAEITGRPEFETMYSVNPEFATFTGSCRDVAVKLPQDTVGAFAGIAAGFIKSLLSHARPQVAVWEQDLESLSYSKHVLPTSNIRCYEAGEWIVRISERAICDMKEYRVSHLPNETGGVLLGAFDTARKIIYIVRVIPSPIDSVEWPTSYIRGVSGLRKSVEEDRKITRNELDYVGEWHSHPEGIDTAPSRLDLQAHTILTELMSMDGLPSLMLIVGESDDPYLLLSSV